MGEQQACLGLDEAISVFSCEKHHRDREKSMLDSAGRAPLGVYEAVTESDSTGRAHTGTPIHSHSHARTHSCAYARARAYSAPAPYAQRHAC